MSTNVMMHKAKRSFLLNMKHNCTGLPGLWSITLFNTFIKKSHHWDCCFHMSQNSFLNYFLIEILCRLLLQCQNPTLGMRNSLQTFLFCIFHNSFPHISQESSNCCSKIYLHSSKDLTAVSISTGTTGLCLRSHNYTLLAQEGDCVR